VDIDGRFENITGYNCRVYNGEGGERHLIKVRDSRCRGDLAAVAR
jgi:hypothetical protein